MNETADHREAARAILRSDAPLREKEGQFLGGLAYRADPITERQANWLAVLVRRYVAGEAADNG